MRIAIYTSPLPLDKITWREEDWFAFEVITRLAKKHPDKEFVWITPYSLQKDSFQFDTIPHFPLSEKPPSSFSFTRNHDRKLFTLLKDQKADALLSLQATLSNRIPCPFCLVVQHPVPASAPGRKIRRFSKELESAGSIATISEFEKEKLSSLYAIPMEEITVIQRGIQEDFHPFEWDERELIKSEYTDGHEYFIYPGEMLGKQLTINLLKAFSILKKRLRSNMVLLLAGDINKNFEDFPELLGTYYFRADVKWIKKITLKERMRLIGGAYALICPPSADDFRPEILEAFTCRVPVLASDDALTRETGEEAILYFNPLNIENTGDVFCEIYKDEDIRSRLIAMGEVQAKKYSWDKTITLLWSALDGAMHQ